MYPDISRLNHFSISTLAYSVDKQVEWKLGHKDSAGPNMLMFFGKSVHEYIQNRFHNTSYVEEGEVRYMLPYRWQFAPVSDIWLLGHIDMISHEEKTIIELKTSVFGKAGSDFSEYYYRQAGMYGKIMKDKTGVDYTVLIARLNHSVQVVQVTPEQQAQFSGQLIQRAYEAAQRLDYSYQSGMFLSPAAEKSI